MEVAAFVAPQLGATYDDLLAAARAAEESGFWGFFRSDHYLQPGVTVPPGPTDAWVSLAGLARETTRVRLGTLVSPVTFRLPGPLAVMVAQVDAMSGGRAVLGLGAGWLGEEHAAYGVPFPPARDRFDQLAEQLAVITGLWTTPPGATFDHAGRWYTLTGSPALPRPVQQPHPPIVVGGYGPERTARIAARFADEFNAPPPHAARRAGAAYDRVARMCEEAGRDPASLVRSATVTVVCGETAREVARRRERTPGPIGEPDVAGSPAEVAEHVAGLADLGVDRVYLRLVDLHDPDHIRLLGGEVLPLLP